MEGEEETGGIILKADHCLIPERTNGRFMHTKWAFLLFFSAGSIFGQTDTSSLIGKPAPQFRLADQNAGDGSIFSLSEWFSADSSRGVIVSFFATWCEPCRKELPFLQHTTDSLFTRDLRMVAVCIDTVYGPKQKQLVADLKLSCPVIHDRFGIVAQRFGCGKALPYTVFINRNGMVTSFSTGYDFSKNTGIIRSINLILDKG